MQGKPEWDGRDPAIIEAVRRHMARKPEPPTVAITASISEYNRRWRQYNEAFSKWEDVYRAAYDKLGGVTLDEVIERHRR